MMFKQGWGHWWLGGWRLTASAAVWFAFTSCTPAREMNDIVGPEGSSELMVEGQAAAPVIFEGESAELSAVASDGVAPYLYRWDQNGGPTELTLSDLASDTIRIDALTKPGQYVFRVTVTDSDGFHATDFVAVEVAEALTVAAPTFAIVGERTDLSAAIEIDSEGVELVWEVVRGSASLDDPTSTNPTLTTTMGEVVEVLLTVSLPSSLLTPITTTRSFEIVSIHDLTPEVLIETHFGDITLELDVDAAPLHTAGFLLYVDDGFYDGLLFHRNVCTDNLDTGECEPFVLQGGGFRRVGEELESQEGARDSIPSEADNGLSNSTVYSVALALVGGDADSGATQFFINLQENSVLDVQDFTVFGFVVDGTEVVDAIAMTERIDSPFIFGEVSLPAEDVTMERVSRINP